MNTKRNLTAVDASFLATYETPQHWQLGIARKRFEQMGLIEFSSVDHRMRLTPAGRAALAQHEGGAK